MSTLLLTGVTGFLGPFIFEELNKSEIKTQMELDTIRLLVRKPEKVKELTSPFYNIEVIKGDLKDPNSLKKATENVTAVIHAASILAPGLSEKEFVQTNVEGAKNLVAGLARGSTFVLTGASSIYGFQNPQFVKESYEPKKPIGFYSKTKLIQEKAIKALCETKSVNFVVLRPSAIIGSGDNTFVPILMKMIEKKRIRLVRDGQAILAIAHPKDVAQAHVQALLKARELNGSAFNIASFHTSIIDLLDCFTNELNLPKIRKAIPYHLLYSLAYISEKLPIHTEIDRFVVKIMGIGLKLDISQAQERLGFSPEYDLHSTIQEATMEYK